MPAERPFRIVRFHRHPAPVAAASGRTAYASLEIEFCDLVVVRGVSLARDPGGAWVLWLPVWSRQRRRVSIPSRTVRQAIIDDAVALLHDTDTTLSPAATGPLHPLAPEEPPKPCPSLTLSAT